MKSKANWEFSQVYAAKQSRLFGLIQIVFAIIAIFMDVHDILGITIALVVFLATCIITLYRTEKALKHFEANQDSTQQRL